MDVKEIDVGGAELLERLVDGDVEGLLVVADIVCLLFDITAPTL